MREKDPAAQAMARKRAASLSPERRKEIGQMGAAARWGRVIMTKAEAQEAVARVTRRGDRTRIPEQDPGPLRRQCSMHKLPLPCRRCTP